MQSRFVDDKLIVQVREIATVAHAGQKRKFGNKMPYITHPEAVAAGVEARLYGTIPDDLLVATIAAAWLHDTVEDTDVTIDDLIEANMPSLVVIMVDNLTKRKGEETYYDYIIRLASARTIPRILRTPSRWIKAEDLVHNASDLHKGSLLDKYRFAYARVTGEHPPF